MHLFPHSLLEKKDSQTCTQRQGVCVNEQPELMVSMLNLVNLQHRKYLQGFLFVCAHM